MPTDKVSEVIQLEQERQELMVELVRMITQVDSYVNLLTDARKDYKLAVRAAYRGGVTMPELRELTGLTRQRIRAIVDEAEAAMFNAAN